MNLISLISGKDEGIFEGSDFLKNLELCFQAL